MKQTVKWLAAALIALGLNQAVWADDVSDFRENLQAAEQGDADAQNNLGAMYAERQGVRRDDAEAVRWFRKAADQGLAQAQFNLGAMYYKGHGVRQDRALAQEWLGKACQNGNQDGCDNDQRLKAGY
ncbi:tetratricopeptide repeat protein [Neisseria meningitidis]|uniref:tetratricopeptide repeat protein n=1 Tax=Neisseria meningitidis TaxID=487 RepID=UPI0001FBF93A|nr:tetratricopeptide repeat protein [Neisseria meningitidis]EGC51694.1 sel1 repeat protein [Neisseria meningitidis N1568]ELK68181.1 sel1 repeat family protein [Neisseria meningitidis 97021]ELK74390.1 sel1 repeat family protein [Neisseria meningitidis 2006087]ELK78473.1 sel1 repeat family protein [Neisseria meningitidis 2002038]ELK80127.1 sel1 repeat family protein [Neisseria meningitidis 97014]